MRNEIEDAIRRFLEAHRIEDFHFEGTPGGHRRVVVSINGKGSRFVVFGSTPSDVRSARNTLSDLRHTLGLIGVRAARKAVQRAKKRKPCIAVAAANACVPRPIGIDSRCSLGAQLMKALERPNQIPA